MRSKIGKIKLNLDRLEWLKYKTERRVDNLKRNIVELSKLIEAGKREILKREKTNDEDCMPTTERL